MTVPQEYVHASRDFERFMADFMEISMIETHHRAYAIVRAVLHVFRDHLAITDALRFAEILPAVLRAIFVENWHPAAEPVPFPDRASLAAEVKANRRDHNLASDSSIAEVAAALRRNVDNAALRRNVDNAALEGVLAGLPAAARDYWRA